MSIIAVYVDGSDVPATALMALHRITGRGFADLKRTFGSGRALLAWELFDPSHEDKAGVLRDIAAWLEDHSIRSRIYEFPEGDTLQTPVSSEKFLIGTAGLRALLDHSDREVQRQMGEP